MQIGLLDIKDISEDGILAYGQRTSNPETELIPAAVKYLKESGRTYMSIRCYNGDDAIDVTFTKNMDEQEVIEFFNDLKSTTRDTRDDVERQYQNNKTKFKLRESEIKRDAHDPSKNVYKGMEEALDALRAIEPIDLSSPFTTKEQVIAWSAKVLGVLYKSQDLPFDSVDKVVFSNELRRIGGVSISDFKHRVRSEFLPKKEVLAYADNPNDVTFPLYVIGTFLEIDGDKYESYIDKLTDGGFQYSWITSWLKEVDNLEAAMGDAHQLAVEEYGVCKH